MTRRRSAIGSYLACMVVCVASCVPAAPTPCNAPAGEPAPTANAVCERLVARECHLLPAGAWLDAGADAASDAGRADAGRLEECLGAFEEFRAQTDRAEFERLTVCYMRAETCKQVSHCSLTCSADGGRVVPRDSDGAVADVAADIAADVVADVTSDAAVDAPADAAATDAADANDNGGG